MSLTTFSLYFGGCSEGLDAFRFFLKQKRIIGVSLITSSTKTPLNQVERILTKTRSIFTVMVLLVVLFFCKGKNIYLVYYYVLPV